MKNRDFPLIAAVLFLFLWTGAGSAGAADAGVTIATETAPAVFVSSPSTTAASVEAYRYPVFGESSSDNEACAEKLRTEYSLAPISAERGGFFSVPGVSLEISRKKDDTINYGTDSSLLITWIIRVEGEASPINPFPTLCSPWHGSILQSFPAGKVTTRIDINGKKVPITAEMTLPDAGMVNQITISDPTITGSYVLTPDFFSSGRLPDKIVITMEWQNDTSMKAVSRSGFREIKAMVIPKTSLRE
ncbi:MAG: hypothetical protein GX606_02305 [Elusimicrobia bacterium]|nr:hypothetical protein [Elusimicrobiota bacterium]